MVTELCRRYSENLHLLMSKIKKMAKKKLIEINIISTQNRLDGEYDHLAKLRFDDETIGYLPLRTGQVNAHSFYTTTIQSQEKHQWVTFLKKRTVKATARALYNANPETLCKSDLCFYTLNQDDQEKRKKNKLAKRQWKVHQLAHWSNGFFVARLSCSTKDLYNHNDSQFILYPALFQQLDNLTYHTNWSIYSKHGRLNSTTPIKAKRLIHALDERNWTQLSAVLNEIEFGYQTAIEAIAGFEYIIAKQKIAPTRQLNYQKHNSKRQAKISDDITIEILDEYQGNNNKSWLFQFCKHTFIMKEDHYTPNKVTLNQGYVSTNFTTAIQSAKQLIAQWECKYSEGDNHNEGWSKWNDLIITDLWHRYFCEQLTSSWILTHIIFNDDHPIGLLAQCFPEPSLAVPAHSTPLTYRALIVQNNKLLDLSRSYNEYYDLKYNATQFSEYLTKILAENVTTTSQNELNDILVYTRGFVSQELAFDALKKYTYNELVHINGGACPISPTQKLARFDYVQAEHKAKIIQRIANGRTDPSALKIFEKHLLKRKSYPRQLLKKLTTFDLLSGKNSTTQLKDVRYGTNVDKIKNTRVSTSKTYFHETDEHQKINKKHSASITSIKKSNAGRKRKYENDAHRKREWAKKNRAAIKEKNIKLNIKPAKVGRKARFSNAAERQKHYRFNKKWLSLSNQSALIIVIDENNIPATLLFQINAVLPYFKENIYCVIKLSKDLNKPLKSTTQILKDLEIILPNFNSDKVYFNSSHKLDEDIIKNIFYSSIQSINLCGFGILKNCLPIALSLNDEQIPVILQKDITYEKTKQGTLKNLNIYKSILGSKSII